MEIKEIRTLDNSELLLRLKNFTEELFNLRFQIASGKIDNPRRIREVKKIIAKIKTVLKERELKNEGKNR